MSTTVYQTPYQYNTDSNVHYIPLQKVIPILKAFETPWTAALAYGSAAFQTDTRSIKTPLKVKKLETEIHHWRTGNKLPRESQIDKAAGYNTTDTTFELDSGTAAYFVVDDVIINSRTQEQMLVTAVDTSADTITVQRAPASGSSDLQTGQKPAAAILDDDTLVRVGVAKKDGATVSQERVTLVTPYQNYAQFFDKSWAATIVAKTTKFHGGDPLTQEQLKAVIDLAIDFEAAVVFGQPSIQTASGGATQYRMCGFYRWIEVYGQNVNVGGALTRDIWDDWLASLDAIDASKKLIGCSRTVLKYIDSWADAKVQVDNNVSSLGVNVTSYKSTAGVYQLFHQPMLDESWTPDSIAAVPQYMTLMQKIPWTMKVNTQANNEYKRKDAVYGEYSLEVEFPNTGGSLTGVS